MGAATQQRTWQPPACPVTSVYFAQSGPDAPIKIGKANHPDRRVSALNAGNPSGLLLLATVPADAKTENELQWEFRRSSIGGEWFRPDPDLVYFILWVAEPAPCRRCRFPIAALWDRHPGCGKSS